MPQRRASVEIFLQPAEYAVRGGDARIRTLLGSCVSITLWHPGRRVGAMCHYLLATRVRRQTDGPPDSRYGDEAMMLMLRDLRALRIPQGECRAKVFGGAKMFPGQTPPSGVGHRNVAAAHALLDAHGIPVVSSSVYGSGHRLIVFDVASGDVWSRMAEAGPEAQATGAGP